VYQSQELYDEAEKLPGQLMSIIVQCRIEKEIKGIRMRNIQVAKLENESRIQEKNDKKVLDRQSTAAQHLISTCNSLKDEVEVLKREIEELKIQRDSTILNLLVSIQADLQNHFQRGDEVGVTTSAFDMAELYYEMDDFENALKFYKEVQVKGILQSNQSTE
jgi:hypothetical protein